MAGIRKYRFLRGDFIPFLIFLFLIVFSQITLGFGLLDEIWIYSIVRAVARGSVLYRDINTILMPLHFALLAVPVSIGGSLLSYRIGVAVITLFWIFSIYRMILRNTGRYYALPVAVLVLLFNQMTTYNTLMMLFMTYVYRLHVTMRKEGGPADRKAGLILFGTGFFSSCAVLTRQTTGTLFMLVETALMIRFLRKRYKWGILYYLAGIAAPFAVFLAYLLSTSSFTAFWDNCLFGLFKFGSENSAFYSSCAPWLIIFILGGISDVLLYRRGIFKDGMLHLIFGICLFTVAVPIVDQWHVFLPAVWMILPVAISIRLLFGKELTVKTSVIITALTSAVMLISGVKGLADQDFIGGYPELEHVPSDPALIEGYEIVLEANGRLEDLGYRVAVFSSGRGVLSMMNGTVNFPEDVFLSGSTGSLSPIDYAADVCASPSTVIAIAGDYIGSVGNFDYFMTVV